MEELIIAAVSSRYSTRQNQNKASDSELCVVSSRKTALLPDHPAFKNTRNRISSRTHSQCIKMRIWLLFTLFGRELWRTVLSQCAENRILNSSSQQ